MQLIYFTFKGSEALAPDKQILSTKALEKKRATSQTFALEQPRGAPQLFYERQMLNYCSGTRLVTLLFLCVG